jgi:Leucine-rich repeat (LRR) protein
MKFPYIILLIFSLLSCTQTKIKESSHLEQDTHDDIGIYLPSKTTHIDPTVIIGGYNTRYTLSRADMETEFSISIAKTECADFSGIEHFANLRRLFLYLWETSDIDFSPLKSLSKLRFINLRGSALTEIPDLSDIPLLAILELDYNNLTSLNGLEKIPQLEKLYIQDARLPIADTSALRYIKSLQELYIITTSFNIDFKNLADLLDLKEISFSNCGELDLTGIGQLSQLKKLRLEIGVSEETGKQSTFRNIQEIGKMIELEELYLDEEITSVGFLANNVNLEDLTLISGRVRPGYYTGATLPLDVAPLGNLKKLKYLTMRGFDLKNAHVLDTLPELKTLDTRLFDDYR